MNFDEIIMSDDYVEVTIKLPVSVVDLIANNNSTEHSTEAVIAYMVVEKVSDILDATEETNSDFPELN